MKSIGTMLFIWVHANGWLLLKCALTWSTSLGNLWENFKIWNTKWSNDQWAISLLQISTRWQNGVHLFFAKGKGMLYKEKGIVIHMIVLRAIIMLSISNTSLENYVLRCIQKKKKRSIKDFKPRIKILWGKVNIHGIVMHKNSGVDEETVQCDFQVNTCLESGWAVVCLNGIRRDFLCIFFFSFLH